MITDTERSATRPAPSYLLASQRRKYDTPNYMAASVSCKCGEISLHLLPCNGAPTFRQTSTLSHLSSSSLFPRPTCRSAIVNIDSGHTAAAAITRDGWDNVPRRALPSANAQIEKPLVELNCPFQVVIVTQLTTSNNLFTTTVNCSFTLYSLHSLIYYLQHSVPGRVQGKDAGLPRVRRRGAGNLLVPQTERRPRLLTLRP